MTGTEIVGILRFDVSLVVLFVPISDDPVEISAEDAELFYIGAPGDRSIPIDEVRA